MDLTAGGTVIPEVAARVTVVIACRDGARTIAAAVRSAIAEPCVVQCVVVDDASDDGSLEVVAQLAGDDPRVESVVRPVRGGPAAARNAGLVRARGELVCFLDADDALLGGGLAALEAALSVPGAVVALGRFRAIDDEGRDADVGQWADVQLRPVVRRHGQLVESPDGVSPEALVTRLISPPPGAWLVERGAALALGGFDPRVRRSEDLEFLVRLATSGGVVCTDREVLLYRRHDAQRSAAHVRRRWGRGAALWAMLRAAPGSRATRQLARGMAGYHLELFASRRRATGVRTRAMGARNLLVGGVLRVEGAVASVLPRRLPAPLVAAGVDAVD